MQRALDGRQWPLGHQHGALALPVVAHLELIAPHPGLFPERDIAIDEFVIGVHAAACQLCALMSDVAIRDLSSLKRTFSAAIPAKENDNDLFTI